MATLTIRPMGAGDVTTIPLQNPGSGSHWEKVDEAVPDEFSTCVYDLNIVLDESHDSKDLYALANHTAETGVINFIKVYARLEIIVGGDGTAQANILIKTNGVEHEGAPATGPWDTVSTQYNTNPQVGGAWTWAQIDALQAGARFQTYSSATKGSEGDAYCTQIYVEVDYTVIVAPTVTTQAADLIAATTARGNGNITDKGGENCSNRGVEWGLDDGGPYPNSHTDAGAFGTGPFTKGMTGLPPGTTIYYRAKANNSAGWGYGGQQSFVTESLPSSPSSSTASKMLAAGMI